ncbi:unnamed protein product [Angiostrongylus costaricensis]|uniref:Craniofacial development protein 2-like n=1 Tax=Angiostrongylus costaricensis TaxID=334426 RepID=A0A0R3Q2I2_ANGCS|nr:unnamed protein product [Angiostrongylus costaricensis]
MESFDVTALYTNVSNGFAIQAIRELLEQQEEAINIYGFSIQHFIVLLKVIIGDFNAKIGPRRTSEERHIGTHGLEWYKQDAVVDNIDEEYDRLIQHLHVSAMKDESSKVTKRRLYPERPDLMRQRGIARAVDHLKLTLKGDC